LHPKYICSVPSGSLRRTLEGGGPTELIRDEKGEGRKGEVMGSSYAVGNKEQFICLKMAFV
jgi:hypothetical protein